MVGLTRFELVTPRLSSVCSNQLSYRPSRFHSNETCNFKEPNFAFGFVEQAVAGLPAEARSTKADSLKTR